MPHLLVDISAHGYGHVSQTAAVVNELARRLPGLRITLRTAAPAHLLKQRFARDFRHLSQALDFGMKMINAVDADIAQSMAAYRAFHTDWDDRVARAAEDMRALKPDLLLSNVPYLSLAAARKAEVRAVGMCCLNWADIYRYYAPDNAESRAIHAQMLAAYNSAALFLKVQPSMPMPELTNARSISPIARTGRNCRAHTARHLSLNDAARVVLVAMGGMEFRLPMEDWPRLEGVHWLMPRDWRIARSDMTAFESLGLSFEDLLASCDAVLTKPGYGTFTEAAAAGVPVLYVSRRNWPEEPYLVQWLQQNGVCLEADRAQLQRGDLQDVLAQLWRMPKPPLPGVTGAAEAVQILLDNYF